jgi:hypothetical protein
MAWSPPFFFRAPTLCGWARTTVASSIVYSFKAQGAAGADQGSEPELTGIAGGRL